MNFTKNLLLLFAFLCSTLNILAQVESDPKPSVPAEETVGQPSTTIQPQLTPEELAQRQKEAEEAAAAGCAMCGGGIAGIAAIFLVVVALNIALLIWVTRDAKSRGMDSSVLWMFLVMFTGLIGLVIYLFSRPQGELAICPHCKGKRLAVSAICPHCRNS